MTTSRTQRLPQALLALRLGVFIVMFMWVLDKFEQPGHAAWPRLAACFALYILWDADRLLTWNALTRRAS